MRKTSRSRLGVTVWGARGSIPAFSRQCVIHGCNTSCYEIRTSHDLRVIVDGGTGIYALGQQWAKQSKPIGPVHVFLSHVHWDHIHGLPLCPLLYRPDVQLHVYSHIPDIIRVLKMQHELPYFPLSCRDVKAKCEGYHLQPNQSITLGKLSVTTLELQHHGGGLGFSFSYEGKTLAVVTDHEVGMVPPEKRDALDRFLAGVQLLLHDIMFLTHIPEQVGWGHTMLSDFVQLPWAKKERNSRKTRKHLVVTHHEPLNRDAILNKLSKKVKTMLPHLSVSFAKEGKTYWCT